MPDDQVRIDPEFLPSPPQTGRSVWLRFGVVAAAAFLLGWLLRSPTTAEPATTEGVLPRTTTTLTQETTSPIPPSTPMSSTTTVATVGLEVPLREAVPGFADAITMVVAGGVWGEEVEVLRWLPSREAPETVLSFREDSPESWGFVGLDAAGTWYAVQEENAMLSVRPVAAIVDDGWWQPAREVVGLRVVTAVWHDTAPGRLAWLSCSRAFDGPTTLYTLDVADRTAEPRAMARLPDSCGEIPMWINGWGDWGFALERMEYATEGDAWDELETLTILLDPGGAELAQIEHGARGPYMVAAGPEGTVWNEELIEGPAQSFLLSLDGQQRNPVPGLAEGEWVEVATWSPDGSLIALVVFNPQADRSAVRIVDAATGMTTAEIDKLGPVVLQTCWSSDGRYLLVGHDRDERGAAGVTFAVYDTASAAIGTETPFREAHDFREIRMFGPSSIAVQFTPLDWGIDLEEGWGPGVYTVRMSAEASPLLTEQIEGIGGKLIWDEVVVELCNIGIDGVGGGFVEVGDTFQTVEGCGVNPDAMQEAFDQFGLPELACLVLTTGGVDHEYCAPLR